MSRSRSTTIAAIIAASLFAAGCKAEKQAEMPPARGEGAAPLPELPDLGKAVTERREVTGDPARTTGTLFARATADVAAKSTGVITHIAVDQGDRVKKGALLFRVDARGAALQRDQALAAQKAAGVQLAAVKVEYDRAERLKKQNALTQAAFDQISARYQAAQVATEQAAVAVAMARKALSDTRVRAPIAGTVTARRADVGDTVSTMPPTVVLQIQDQSVVELRFTLPESALGTVAKGTKIRARFASEPKARELVVDRVDPVVDPSSRTLTAIVLIDNPEGILRPGMLAEIDMGGAPAKEKSETSGADE